MRRADLAWPGTDDPGRSCTGRDHPDHFGDGPLVEGGSGADLGAGVDRVEVAAFGGCRLRVAEDALYVAEIEAVAAVGADVGNFAAGYKGPGRLARASPSRASRPGGGEAASGPSLKWLGQIRSSRIGRCLRALGPPASQDAATDPAISDAPPMIRRGRQGAGSLHV